MPPPERVRAEEAATSEADDSLSSGTLDSYYTALPPPKKSATTSTEAAKIDRTFCLLPHLKETKAFFSPNKNTKAEDEITAHVEMFTDASDGMYTLGRESDALIREWLEQARKREAGK